MTKKKIIISAISIVFAVVTVISVFMMFTVKEVKVKFSVYTDTNETRTLQEKFDKFTDKNLIFFNADEVRSVDVGSRFEIESVKKSYPNVIKVSVKERKERFVVSFGDDYYVISDEGYVLDCASDTNGLIKVNLSGITLNEPVLGVKLSSDRDDDLYNAITLANVSGVVDACNEMTVEYVGKTMRSVIFLTKTDVKIRIPMATEYGKEKTQTAFNAYFNETRDYIKSYSEIRVDIQPDGTLKCVWVQQ